MVRCKGIPEEDFAMAAGISCLNRVSKGMMMHLSSKRFSSGLLFILSLVVTAAAKPNVLFIAIDDLRPELGCYGHKHILSPNIDQLAAEGVRFDRAYCQQSVCNPSRASILTGLRPDATQVHGNHSHYRDNHPDIVTLPQHFKNHGYHTQAFGKIYHGVFPKGSSKTVADTFGDPISWSVPAYRPGPRYYHTEEGIAQAKKAFLSMYRPVDPEPDDWTKKLVFGPMTEAPDVPDELLYDGLVAQRATEALRDLAESDLPFFLAVGFIKPHSPFIAPKKYWDLYDPSQIDLAPNQSAPEDAPRIAMHGSGEIRRYTDQPNKGKIPSDNQRRMKHGYAACISYVDAQVGKVLSELDQLGLRDDTMVILWSDHGYHLGEKDLWGKTTNFELDSRVAMIVSAPGRKGNGQATKALVELVDLYPTLVELAELPSPSHELQGKSFSVVLDEPSRPWKKAAFSQYTRRGHRGYSLTDGRYRYTEWIDLKSGELASSELYDHQSDPDENRNLANDDTQQEILLRLRVMLAKGEGWRRADPPELQLGEPLGVTLINDVAVEKPMRVESVAVTQPVNPLLIGKEDNPILTVNVRAAGSLRPKKVRSVTVQILDTAPIAKVRVYHEGILFGETLDPKEELIFTGEQVLANGLNAFRVSCELKSTATFEQRVDARLTNLEIDGIEHTPANVSLSGPLRIGVAVRRAGQDGCHTYRIPGLATTNQGTLVAVYDNRYRGSGDLPNDIDVGR